MSRPKALTGLLALLWILSPLPGRADDALPPVEGFGAEGQLIDLSGPVTLQRCVGLALAQNFNVRIQQYGIFEAVDAVDVQKAVYEPVFNLNVNEQVNKGAANEIALGIVPYASYDTASFSVDETLLTGGTLTAGYSLVRTDYSPAYVLPNPSYAGNVTVTVNQPLLQGAGTAYGRALIESARLGVRISNLNFKSTILTMILNVETTYYNLLYQREQYKVQEEELHQAQQLLDENTVRRQTGVLTDLDVMNARAGVASAQNLLILDRQYVQNSEDSLLQLLGDRRFVSSVGEVSFPDVGEPQVSFARSYKLARENGPNLAIAQATIDQYKLSALRAKRNMLPELNVNGGGGYGSFEPTISQSLVGAYNGYNWTAGVTLSIPWGMKANKAIYHSALAQVRSEEVAYDQADQALVVNVRSAVRGVDSNLESVKSSEENTKYATKAYELTKAQFDAGLATSYLVLQAQNTLESARVSELQAKVNLLVALATLRFYEGTSLQVYGIRVPE